MSQRVLIIKLPSLLRQIVRDALALDGRAEVVDAEDSGPDEEIDLAEAILRHEPDVIVTMSTEQSLDPAFQSFISGKSGRRVLTIERVGRSAYVFSMLPEPVSLGEMSTDALVRAIHDDVSEH